MVQMMKRGRLYMSYKRICMWLGAYDYHVWKCDTNLLNKLLFGTKQHNVLFLNSFQQGYYLDCHYNHPTPMAMPKSLFLTLLMYISLNFIILYGLDCLLIFFGLSCVRCFLCKCIVSSSSFFSHHLTPWFLDIVFYYCL
jgi:hypothetical protein